MVTRILSGGSGPQCVSLEQILIGTDSHWNRPLLQVFVQWILFTEFLITTNSGFNGVQLNTVIVEFDRS